MFSQTLLEKWSKLLKERYGQKNLTKREVFEIANTITNYFDLIIKFYKEDELKQKQLYEKDTKKD